MLGTLQQRHALAEHHSLGTVGAVGQAIGQADERGHIFGGGTLVEVLRSGDLLDAPVVHDADAIGHGERLLLIVGHEHGGGAGLQLDAADLVAQLHTHLGVQCG